MAHFAIQRDPRYFSNPESFIPERWLRDGKSVETCVRKAFLGFGHGPRECLGKQYTPPESPRADGSLAILEMKMIFSGILLKFDLDFAGEPIDPLDDFWSQISPLHVRITNFAKGN
jgi:cytochrome P450